MRDIDLDRLEKGVLENKRNVLMAGGKDLFMKNRGRLRSRDDVVCLLAAGYLKARRYPVTRNMNGEMVLPLVTMER
jgi:hypothetical protein